jgi:hypothetical protein
MTQAMQRSVTPDTACALFCKARAFYLSNTSPPFLFFLFRVTLRENNNKKRTLIFACSSVLSKERIRHYKYLILVDCFSLEEKEETKRCQEARHISISIDFLYLIELFLFLFLSYQRV